MATATAGSIRNGAINATTSSSVTASVSSRPLRRNAAHCCLFAGCEETIIARVGEGIVSTIGSSKTIAAVLENPDLISKAVLAGGLDAGTAFEILSIDIADVDSDGSIITAKSVLASNWGIIVQTPEDYVLSKRSALNQS